MKSQTPLSTNNDFHVGDKPSSFAKDFVFKRHPKPLANALHLRAYTGPDPTGASTPHPSGNRKNVEAATARQFTIGRAK
jgi:hypothetical protein